MRGIVGCVASRLRGTPRDEMGSKSLNNMTEMNMQTTNRNIMCKAHPSCGDHSLLCTGLNWEQVEMDGLKKS